MAMELEPIIILGQKWQCGAYVLRVTVQETLQVRFGRFRNGAAVQIPRGELVYVGSAMGARGSSTLARRLLRHASRSDPARPQPLRAALLDALAGAEMGLPGLRPPRTKRPFWHIDYLLEEPGAALEQIYILRSATALEQPVATLLHADPATTVLALGLGAQDQKNGSHLLGVQAGPGWWARLPDRLRALMDDERG